jgi:hypothetical protein
MSNEKKDATLGMSHGTATNRLRKQIMFRLLQRLNENFCFRCGCEIQSVDDLSIEHKQPWEGISADLFWDEENIAFSHLRCNRPDRPSGRNANAKIPPIEGVCWCVPGDHFAPVDNFYKNESRPTGLQNWCKDHRPPRLGGYHKFAMLC